MRWLGRGFVLGYMADPLCLFRDCSGGGIIVNSDGLEWKRAKYNIVERSIIILYFTFSLNLATKIAAEAIYWQETPLQDLLHTVRSRSAET